MVWKTYNEAIGITYLKCQRHNHSTVLYIGSHPTPNPSHHHPPSSIHLLSADVVQPAVGASSADGSSPASAGTPISYSLFYGHLQLPSPCQRRDRINSRRCIRYDENKRRHHYYHVKLTQRFLVVMAGGDRSVIGSWTTTTAALVTEDVASLMRWWRWW